MTQHQLTEHIPLRDGNGFIPCSTEYRDVLAARDAIHRPSPEAYWPQGVSLDDRRR